MNNKDSSVSSSKDIYSGLIIKSYCYQCNKTLELTRNILINEKEITCTCGHVSRVFQLVVRSRNHK